MKRARRRSMGLAASAAVHVAAFLVLTPVVFPHVRTRLATADDAVIQVQLIRLRDGLGRSTSPPPADQPSELQASTPGTPQPPRRPVPPEPPREDDTAEPSVVAQNAPLDLDPLWRVPFRDAAGQAEAALRAGLGCAHVDLEQLSQTLIDRCQAEDRKLRAGARPAPDDPSAPGAKA
jgi:hypothetical protein